MYTGRVDEDCHAIRVVGQLYQAGMPSQVGENSYVQIELEGGSYMEEARIRWRLIN